MSELVPGLEALLGPAPSAAKKSPARGGVAVVDRREVAPNFHRITLHAPAIASHAQPGQFLIVMAHETSERAPFTLVDWDSATGNITFVVEETGRSSRELAALRPGDCVAHAAGPLGMVFPIRNYGTVVLAGGCYGIAAIYPLARALKQAGNRVVGMIEASSEFLLYFEDELRTVCDELLVATRDGSRGLKGGADRLVAAQIAQRPPELVIGIGCTFMMQLLAESCRPAGVPLQVALNPIMVDGTGMCGACRVSIAGKTRFACVDGPFFDGHSVDWAELAARRQAYSLEEIEALPQASCSGAHHHHHHHHDLPAPSAVSPIGAAAAPAL